MSENTKTRRLGKRAEQDYRDAEKRIAPFVVPKPIKPVSTAGQWRDSSSQSVCVPSKR